MSLRVGTRASALALWQTERVRGLLGERGHSTTRTEIRTTGDVILDVPLAQIGSRALFTKQLDDALLAGTIDLAVHSLKDLPTVLPEGLAIGAVGLREDPRDALVARGAVQWGTLPQGAGVATSSLRRRAQLLRARPDLLVHDIRGNVDTRLAKLDASNTWSAILLAAAGLERLGFGDRITDRLPMDVMLPAPGQGALAVTVRADDARTTAAVRDALHDETCARAVAAERAFLRRLEGGCQVPVAAHAEADGGTLRLRGRVIGLDGAQMVEGASSSSARGEAEADELGTGLAEQLLARGAGEILRTVRMAAGVPVPAPEA